MTLMKERNSNSKSGSQNGRCILTEPSNEADQLKEFQLSLAQLLPVEILSEIFILSIPTSYTSSVNATTLEQWRAFFSSIFPMNLTGACRSWRQAALCTRDLWSTFYLEIHNSSHNTLSMAEYFVKRFLRRSRDCTVRCGIRFTGTLEFARACDSVRPLLEHQERWEEVDICIGIPAEGVANLTLDLVKLSSLRTLGLDGPSWGCIGVDDSLHPENAPQLLSLLFARLDGIRPSENLRILAAAPSLTELSLQVHNGFAAGDPVILPALRKLEIIYPLTAGMGTHRHSILQRLKCRALEELSVVRMQDSSFEQFLYFATRCGLATSLMSLRFQLADNVQPDSQQEMCIIGLLSTLKSLHSLTILHGAISDFFVWILEHVTDGSFYICPLLEELVLGNATADASAYSDLMRARWNAPGKCKSMTFLDCIALSGGRRNGLTHILGADVCVQEGLKLNIRFNDVA